MADEHDPTCRHGVSRRGFLGSVGAGAIAASLVRPGSAGGAPVARAAARVECALEVNGRTHKVLVEPRWTLLYVVRDVLGLTGSKPGCERGECGCCTMLFDGVPRYACLTLALEAEGHRITTVEGLMDGEKLGTVQQAFLEEDALQCGYCTPGQIVAAEGLLRANPTPSLEEIRLGMSGNLCRCGAYPHILKAVTRAAQLKGGAS
ncbi:MAG: (2Fe-2S)-binding protein [Acidobacteriota bacterium]